MLKLKTHFSIAGGASLPVTTEQALGVLRVMEVVLAGVPGLAERPAPAPS
jgi:hypothetical protein